MKKTGVFFLMFTGFLFAGFINLANPKFKTVKPNVILRGALSNSISDLEFYKNKVLIYSYSEFFIRNLLNSSIKTLNIKHAKKVAVYKNFVYVYTYDSSDVIDIYSLQTLKLVKKLALKNSIKSFMIENDKLYALSGYKINVYSLADGEQIKTIKLANYFNNIEKCYDKKYFLLLSGSDIDIYKNDILINRVKYKNSLVTANILNGKLFYITSDNTYGKSELIIKDTTVLQTLKHLKLNIAVSAGFVTNDLKTFIYAPKNAKYLSVYDMPANSVKYRVMLNSYPEIVKLSNDNKYIGITYSDNTYQIMDTSSFISLKAEPNKQKIAQTQSKSENTPQQQAVSVKKKPKLEIDASVSEGFAPLKVIFSILTDGDIKAYYINFGDQEMLKKGEPPVKFVHTFKKPGNYNVFFAVKNKDGLITKKIINIKVKEETFQDYKKTYAP